MEWQTPNKEGTHSKLAFDDHPEFYQDDNRRFRVFNPVSKAFLETKFSILLPPNLVKNKRILDLGSCFGAAGQWVLFHGASDYTGIEVQKTYAEKSQTLLSHWGQRANIIQQDVRSFLQESKEEQYDLVVVAGMLYHFIDTKTIIDEICRVCSESVIVESNFPPGMRSGKLPTDIAVTEYLIDQEVNLADENASLLGISATTSLPALDILFGLYGFSKKEDQLNFPIKSTTVIYDQSTLGHTDLQIRFAVRYHRDPENKSLTTLEDNLPDKIGNKRSWADDIVARQRTQEYMDQAKSIDLDDESGQWRFDAKIAEQFDSIARREIPDYLRVIDLCVRVVSKSKIEQPKIIDVGSAIGQTLKQLYQAGYQNIYGVESSEEMLEKSFDKAILIYSENFPHEYAPFDYVIANWVIHFIPQRTVYLEAIKKSLAPGGTLILTEKVASSECTHDLYYDFKRAKGVTEEEIERKRRQIEGVLVTYPLSWYMDTLTRLGFDQIEIINANTAFITIMAINPEKQLK